MSRLILYTRFLPVLMLPILFTSCAGLGQGGKTPDQLRAMLLKYLQESVVFTLEDVEPSAEIIQEGGWFSLPDVLLSFDIGIGVENNSVIPLVAKSLDVNLFTSTTPFPEGGGGGGDDPLTTGSVTGDLLIKSGEKKTLPITVEITATSLGRELLQRYRGDQMYYKVNSVIDFTWRGVTVPYEVTLTEGGG